MSYIYLIIAFSFFLTLFFVWSKQFHNFTIDEQPLVGTVVAFSSLIFSILLGFAVSSLYEQYQNLRTAIIKETKQLLLIYEISKDIPDAINIIIAIQKYVDSVIEEEWAIHKQGYHNEKSEELYQQINREIIKYTRTHPNDPLNGQLSSTLSVDERQIRINSNCNNNFMIAIVILSGLLAIIGFWFINISSFGVQFIIDFGVITIVALSIYLLLSLNKPLKSKELALTSKEFKILREKINGD